MSMTAVAVAILLLQASPAHTSREAQLAAEEAARAGILEPPVLEPAERIVGLFDGPVTTGFLPSFGGLIPGGSLNAGVAYTRFFADTKSWTTRGVYSIRQFWMIEGSALLPDLWDGRLLVSARGAVSDGPRVEFFGLGNDSDDNARSYYGLRHVDAGVNATLRPAPGLAVFGGGVEFLQRESGHNRGSGRSVEQLFAPAQMPAFGETLRFGHYFGSAGLDWRRPGAGYADSGGLYRATFHAYEADDHRFSFRRVDVDVVQHVPILRANWIVSLRGKLSTTMADDGQEVPFYLLTRLGGSDGVRGYGAYRFLDRHALLLSAEYRWTPGETLDMAVFWDGGRVASTRDGLGLRDLKSSVGIGARIHAPSQTALRIELAVSREGPHVVFTFSPAF